MKSLNRSILFVVGVAAGCVLLKSSLIEAAPTPAPTAKVSTSKDRSEVAITVYNEGFGLVREVRELDLVKGRVALEYRDVASSLQAETVSIKALTGGALNVLEQNYRYDLLSPQKLLEKYVGKMVKIYRWNEKAGKEDGFAAEVLAVNGGSSVLRINGEITYDFPGRIAFPEVPVNLIAKPTLVWLLEASAPKQKVEISYITRGMRWQSDYVLTIDDKDALGDLTGWVTLNNTSGATYEDAKLKLVAGDVRKLAPAGGESYGRGMLAAAAPKAAPTGFKEEGFFEYHLYTLAQPTTLMQNETKQVTLLTGSGVKLQKKLIFGGTPSYWFRSSYSALVKNQKVAVYLDIENSIANKLGIALPKGTVRVYKADSSGSKQFIGEDHIDHTPRDEKLHIKMGDAFDVVGDRKQTDYKVISSCMSESAWEIELRNHKKTAESVELVENVGGDWEIISSSHPTTKRDAFTFVVDPKIPADGKVTVKYRVRVKWC